MVNNWLFTLYIQINVIKVDSVNPCFPSIKILHTLDTYSKNRKPNTEFWERLEVEDIVAPLWQYIGYNSIITCYNMLVNLCAWI